MADNIIGDTTPGRGLINAPSKDIAHGSRYIIALVQPMADDIIGDTTPGRGLINTPGNDTTCGLSGR